MENRGYVSKNVFLKFLEVFSPVLPTQLPQFPTSWTVAEVRPSHTLPGSSLTIRLTRLPPRFMIYSSNRCTPSPSLHCIRIGRPRPASHCCCRELGERGAAMVWGGPTRPRSD